MKIIVTKEELLEFCSSCAERSLKGGCTENCILGAECGGAYIDFWRDYMEVNENA